MITGVLLAGGTGRRFGDDKLLVTLPGDGRALAVAAAEAMVAALDEVVAVVRPGSDSLAAALRAAGCTVVECPEAEAGMGASLACGVRARPAADGWIVGLADMPWIAPGTIAQVAERLAAGAPIVAPVYAGRRGHPVGFAAEFGARLTALAGDRGARELLEDNADRLQLVETADRGVILDVDTAADLLRGR